MEDTKINIGEILQRHTAEIIEHERQLDVDRAATWHQILQVASELAVAARHVVDKPLAVVPCVRVAKYPTSLSLLQWGVLDSSGVGEADVAFVPVLLSTRKPGGPPADDAVALLSLRQRDGKWSVTSPKNAAKYGTAVGAMRSIFTQPEEAARVARVLRNLMTAPVVGTTD